MENPEERTADLNDEGGVPVSAEPTGEKQKMMIKKMKENVFGQDRAIRRAVRAISIFEAKLNDPQRPVGILMFAGPSGSGKTFTAKQLAYAWIGEPKGGLDPVVFIDCGSLSLEHERATLTGSPPGYVGYGEQVGLERVGEYDREEFSSGAEIINRWIEKTHQRLLNEGVAPERIWTLMMPFIQRVSESLKGEKEGKGPYRSVVIFDEFEKAHFNVQKQLLSILEEGKLCLLKGKVIDFTGSLIIFTTNVGTQQILDEYLSDWQIGFKTSVKEKIKKSNGMDKAIWERVRREIESGKYFLPELLGRIGKPGIIVFQTLKHADYLKILNVELSKVQKRLSGNSQSGPEKLSISYTKKFKEFLLREGVDPRYGARALRSVVDKYVIEPVANAILNGELRQNDRILLKIEYKKVKGEDGEAREDAETKILRLSRLDGQEYPLFELDREKVLAEDQKRIEIEKQLDGALKGIMDRLFSGPKSPRQPQ